MNFAMLVARSDSSTIQNVLMDGFDQGLINTSNLPTVRRIIDARLNPGGKGNSGPHATGQRLSAYSLKQLKSDIARVTKEKEAFVHEVGIKENRLVTLLQDLHMLWQNPAWVTVAQEEGFTSMPELNGEYTV